MFEKEAKEYADKVYGNRTESVNTWCRKCNKSSVIRSVKDDTRKEVEK